MIQISGLWINKSKDGKHTYMVGYMGNARIVIMRNGYKEEGKHPDYILYVDENTRNHDSGDDILNSDNDVEF